VKFKIKVHLFYKKNCGYKTMKITSKILERQEVSKNGLSEDINEDDITYLKYAPITSVEVERSFSAFKTILCDNCRSFIVKNIMHTLVVQ